MADLIDPSKMRIVRASHMEGGVELHEAKDCSHDWRCPVWLDLHPSGRLQELYFHLEHIYNGDLYMSWYGQQRAKGVDHSEALDQTIKHFDLPSKPWYKVRLRQLAERG